MSVAESNVPERIERLLARTPPAAALSRVARWSAFAALIPVVVFAASTTRAAPTEPAAKPLWVTAPARIVHAANPDDYYPAVAKHENVRAPSSSKSTWMCSGNWWTPVSGSGAGRPALRFR